MFSVGLCGVAHSGVFSESDNGQLIASEGGILDFQPPSEQSKLTYVDVNRTPQDQLDKFSPEHSPLIARRVEGDPPSARSLAARSLPKARRLPAPRTLSGVRPHQKSMFNLAVSVGTQYAKRREVAEAGISRDEFVAMFTTLIQRESNFDPTAVSSAGAEGLGQLMPGTAEELGVTDSFSPGDNLDGSARYLVEMLGMFGKPEYALAAYNAGPGNVNKYGGIPPFDETRQYVSDILHNTAKRLR